MIGTVIAETPGDCKNTPPPLTETNVECVQQYCENHVSECVNRYSNLKLR